MGRTVFLVQAPSGTLGDGPITRIVRGYVFMSRNHARGDQIFIIGFNRRS